MLPPPPAPTARDANPWPVGSAPREGRGRRHRQPAGTPQEPVRRASAAPRIAVAVAIGLLMLGLLVTRFLEGGEFEDLAGILFAIVFLVLFIATRSRARRRSASRPGESGDGHG